MPLVSSRCVVEIRWGKPFAALRDAHAVSHSGVNVLPQA
jgi:hypothetical protein